MDNGASFGPGSRPSDGADSVVSTHAGFDPSRDFAAVLAGLSAQQRAFILRMEAHADDQVITRHDYAAIDPCVDFYEGWPPTDWFGGMRINFGAGGDGIPRFRFNELGLRLRAAIAKAEDRHD